MGEPTDTDKAITPKPFIQDMGEVALKRGGVAFAAAFLGSIVTSAVRRAPMAGEGLSAMEESVGNVLGKVLKAVFPNRDDRAFVSFAREGINNLLFDIPLGLLTIYSADKLGIFKIGQVAGDTSRGR